MKEANVTSEDELHVSVEDHRYEEYVPSKPKKKPFGGSGHLLGRYIFTLLYLYVVFFFTRVSIYSPVPEVVGENSPPVQAPLNSDVVDETVARAEVPLTPDAPTTSLQIRLVDGTRLVATFNHNHTIGDVRRYIIAYPF